MIKKRPTLPTGHSMAGLPAVTKALHSDERCEVYSLASSGAGEALLLVIRFAEDPSGGDISFGQLVDHSASSGSYSPSSAHRSGISYQFLWRCTGVAGSQSRE